MARYIDADALIKILKADYEDEGLNVEVAEEKGLIYETRKYSYGQSIYLKAIERVKELPIVDVVPKSEVEKIFEEIEKLMSVNYYQFCDDEYNYYGQRLADDIAELKKEYTESEGKE